MNTLERFNYVTKKDRKYDQNQMGRYIDVAYLIISCSDVTGIMNSALNRNLSKTTIIIITIITRAM